ncbi:MAG: MBL fold metallo-hydrolase [Candidatus Aenigmarchaeota archaeon]|nr:MBL fold metallo-hydrolase [Candidatus Aenigmarchaeota archaeon]
MNRIVFLGSGGGRYVMTDQLRKTGGLFFEIENNTTDPLRFSLDPGPGALVHAVSLGLRHDKWDGVVLTHFHPDHATDANALLDGMEKPFLIAEEHCLIEANKLKGTFKDYVPCIFPYHQEKANPCKPVKDKDTITIRGVEFSAHKAKHDVPTMGYRITAKGVDIGYPGDGEYYQGQQSHYDGCRVLILNTLIPKGKTVHINKHMSVDEAITFVNQMSLKPQLIVFNHLSHWMLRGNLWKQTRIMEEATGVKTIAADDFMELDLTTLKTRKLRTAATPVVEREEEEE